MDEKTTRRRDPRRGLASSPETTQTGLPAGTLVLTADGEIPIEYINPGDRIVTRTAGMVRVETVHSRLARTRFVVLQPGALGQGRPGHAALLPASQPVLLRDWRAQSVYGRDQIVVAVGDLADGETIRRIGQRTSVLLTLEFPDPQIIYADGVEIAINATAGALARAA